MPFIALSICVILMVGLIGLVNNLANDVKPTVLLSLSVCQLVAGALFLRILAGNEPLDFRKKFTNLRFSEDGFCQVLVPFVAAVALFAVVFTLTDRVSAFNNLDASNAFWMLFYYVVLIGLAEELLFRALPFAIFSKQKFTALFASSVLFALYHANNGLNLLPYFLSVGLLFGVLRYFDVSILSLAIIHGFFDFALNTVWPATDFRFTPTTFQIVSPAAICFVAASTGWVLSLLRGKYAASRLGTPFNEPSGSTVAISEQHTSKSGQNLSNKLSGCAGKAVSFVRVLFSTNKKPQENGSKSLILKG